MKPSTDPKHGRRALKPGAEMLETRQVLSAGAGNTIAIMPHSIGTAGKPEQVEFRVGPESVTTGRGGSVLLGIDVVPTSTSAVKPVVTTVTDSSGKKVPSSTYATKTPITFNGQVITPAVVAQIRMGGRRGPRANAQPTQNLRAQVVGEQQSVGAFLTGFYLVGDVNGDGVVQSKDINLVRKALNSKVGETNYSFDADANRDGRVTQQDLRLAQQNLGAKTTVLPLVTADLDPASDTGAQDRVTSATTATLTGVASANSVIAYSEKDNKSPTVRAQADATGRYSIQVPLVEGSNTFVVTASDAFGQSITGSIAPITQKPNAT